MTNSDSADEVWTRDDRRNGVTVAQLNDGTGSERVFCHSNTMYSVSGVTDETGALKEAYQYDAYGQHTRITDGPDGDAVVNFTSDDVRVVGARSTLTVPQSFTGQRFDPETGLHYYKNRYYSTELGRFLTRDRLGIGGDQRNRGNGYTYSSDNPMAIFDPEGDMASCSRERIRKGRTDKECCDDAKKLDLDKDATGKHEQGGVICCDGRKVGCAWSANVPGPEGPGKEILNECIRAHEGTHKDDVGPCPPTGTTRARWKPDLKGDKAKAKQAKEECDGFREQLRCLREAEPRCDKLSDPKARSECRKQVDDYKEWILGPMNSRFHCNLK